VTNKIHFFTEELPFKLKQVRKIREAIIQIAQQHKRSIEEINYIFCSDTYLHKINLEYLQHDTFTDIITFDHSEVSNVLTGDIFISIDRVKENSSKFEVDFNQELYRVMSHGLLHLCGFKDKKKEDKEKMTAAENKSLKVIYSKLNAT
jgi:rRNA maturation RNase YbeY